MTLVTRLGTGFDVHAFTEGDGVWLGDFVLRDLRADQARPAAVTRSREGRPPRHAQNGGVACHIRALATAVIG